MSRQKPDKLYKSFKSWKKTYWEKAYCPENLCQFFKRFLRDTCSTNGIFPFGSPKEGITLWIQCCQQVRSYHNRLVCYLSWNPLLFNWNKWTDALLWLFSVSSAVFCQVTVFYKNKTKATERHNEESIPKWIICTKDRRGNTIIKRKASICLKSHISIAPSVYHQHAVTAYKTINSNETSASCNFINFYGGKACLSERPHCLSHSIQSIKDIWV